MQLKLNQLSSHLQKSLAPIYLISGEDPLLKQEARDAIIAKARTEGFQSIERLQVETRFDWNSLNTLQSNQDLFSEKQLIELSNPDSKFDASATKIIPNYCTKISADSLLLVLSGKLTAAQLKTAWYQAIEKIGVCITIWPLNSNEVKAWIKQRLQSRALQTTDQAITLLAELCENNLLALAQALEKLKLLYPGLSSIDNEQVITAVSDNSRYTVFDLINYALQGNKLRVLHILSCLKQQGVEPTLILWALAKEIRLLLSLIQQYEQGNSIQHLIDRENFTKRPFVQMALRRLNSAVLKNLLAELTEADQRIKGLKSADAWLSLNQLSLGLAGINLMSHS